MTGAGDDAVRDGIRCMWMRGGTSKAGVFLAEDLPADPAERDDLLLRIMGTPDPRQIDGLGGATSLTSKVAVVSVATDDDADVDYLFLQLGVDEPTVSDRQNCGNILAAVGPFAVERGLVPAGAETDAQTTVRIRMVNSDSIAAATFPTPGGRPRYAGDVAIAGVPGTAAPVTLAFSDTEGSATGALFPTGNLVDTVEDIEVTCVDNGMPVVLVRAADLGLTGEETFDDLAAATALQARVDDLRRRAGTLMGLGDTAGQSVPKTVAVSAARDGGDVRLQSFIPVTPHQSLGVLAGVSAVTALRVPGAVGHDLIRAAPPGTGRADLEHPSGHLMVDVDVHVDDAGPAATAVRPDAVRIGRSAVVRTARKLFDGVVFPRT
ncbi:FldA protein [Tersicoccus solisilvae]|uniref:FldA protein n=1 Tax=Tersicoccus solisilvae TaxID=1882339 RepID=A0ABQ1NYF0_9MICC|nr:4-oxalomesaconate tautomerase [Tersicoccus solisilvae]GGC85442.1 FldA protein [Tersicoccus solisilvae]